MSADILPIVLRATLTASAAIIVVLLLRRTLRAVFGAEIAYASWLLVPVAALAAFLPARRMFVHTSAVNDAAAPVTQASEAAQAMATNTPDIAAVAQTALSNIEPTPLLLIIWLAGVALSISFLLLGHRRFMRNADAAGPAVVGVTNPRIVLPRDFEQRYTPEERELVIAHERAHIAAFDAQINAVAALAQCLNWFNPLFYAARAALRVDQELACDARVMARHGAAKRVYAEAMLKTQLAAQYAPLGCQWPPVGSKPLKERIAMLARPRPTPLRFALGAALCATATLTAGTLAWATQQPQVIRVAAQQQQRDVATPAQRALGRQLIGALMEGQMTEAHDLIEAGADVNYYLQGDGTPLVIAARFGSRDMVEYLIAQGADVNQAAPGDGNPLIMASMFGHMDVVRILVERGADVNGIVVDDETPLINAARNDQMDVARYLITRGADVNLAVDAMTARGMERRSPLSEARRRGHSAMIAMLRENGAAS